VSHSTVVASFVRPRRAAATETIPVNADRPLFPPKSIGAVGAVVACALLANTHFALTSGKS
jgi:hypothetical protein